MNALAHSRRRGGFTRLELGVILGATTLLCLVAMPLLAQGKPRSQLAICLNNLRQIGRAVLVWNADHEGLDPWRVDFSNGGTRNHPTGLQNNAWFQFGAFTNELRTPKILACPSDPVVRVASSFTSSSAGGFFNPAFQNQALSYFIGLDSFAQTPQSVFSGDPHLRTGPANGGCSSGLAPVYDINFGATGGWNATNLHGASGHLLFHDGRVELRSNARVTQVFSALREAESDNGLWHILTPRPGN